MSGEVIVKCRNVEKSLPFKISTPITAESIVNNAFDGIIGMDNFFRNYTDARILYYNEHLHIRIQVAEHVFLNTEDPSLISHENELKFNRSETSRIKFRQLLLYLSGCGQSEIQFQGLSPKENIQFSRLLKRASTLREETLNGLTDFQKALICSGMEAAEARKLYATFCQNGTFSHEQRSIAEQYILAAFRKYGKNLILQCLQLPQKPFMVTNTQRVFTYFDRLAINQKPSITLLLDDETEVELFYHKKDKKLAIRGVSNGEELVSIDQAGECSVPRKSKWINPSILLLLKVFDDPKQQIIYYGAQTGKCTFCGRKLSQHKSIQYGYGEQCAKKFALDWG